MVLSFLDKVFGKKETDEDIEEMLNTIDVEEESEYENAKAFVKPITLNRGEDITLVINEAKQGNTVLLNISDLGKRNAVKLKELVAELKAKIHEINGDIARISQDRVLVTPSDVKIIKRKE